MSELVYFTFKVNEVDIPAWEKMFELLDAGHQGAEFQMAMEIFGKAASEKLDEILEDEEFGGPKCFVFERWSRERNEFSFELDLPYELIGEFEAVFSLCPIRELNVFLVE